MGPPPYFVATDINVGLLLFLAMSSLGVYAITLGGWRRTTSTRSSAGCARPRR